MRVALDGAGRVIRVRLPRASYSQRVTRFSGSVAEVTKTVADLTRRGITLRCLRNGLDTATSTGRIVADVLTDLAGLDAVSTTEVRP